MKTKTLQFIFFLALILIGSTAISFSQTNPQTVTTPLFNGKDLSNWTFFLRDPAIDPATVFTIQNGVIHIAGNPFGYMRTKEVYSNYKLHVEFRYPAVLSNSGVFIHMQGADTIWPLLFECQLKAGSGGDIVCMNGSDLTQRLDKSRRMVTKLTASVEKPVGEWNTMEVICNGNTIEIYINGTLMNKGTGLSITKGNIGLQSEGGAVEFRNVVISPLFD
jgi:hypothetical protein